MVQDTKQLKSRAACIANKNGSLSSSKGVRLGLGVKKLSVSKLQLADEPLLVLVPPVVLVVGRSSVKQVAESILNTPCAYFFLPQKTCNSS